MPRTLAISRIALTLRRLNARFGIAAPQVAIRTHVPWYWRIFGISSIAALVIALAAWAYDVGSSMAGFDQSETADVIGRLRESNTVLQEEAGRLRSLLAASESGLQIERAAQKQLTERNNLLLDENVRLKEELAVFERLVKPEGSGAGNDVGLDKISVKADGPGRYRFSFLIALQNARRGKDARFNLQIVISPREGSADAKIVLPVGNDPNAEQYEISMRNFRRIEGKFEVPQSLAVGSVEFKVYEAGSLKASRSVSL